MGAPQPPIIMKLTSLFARFHCRLALSACFVAALAGSPAARAVTNDELLPANLVGKTLSFVYNAGTPNTLEPTVNSFTVQFTSASTYVRTSPTLATEGGTYSVLDSSISAATGNRATTIQINNNWLAQGSTTAILLVLTQQAGNGAYSANEFFNPLKNTGGTFTLGGGSTGGGSTVVRPSITSGTTASATVGTIFSYQLAAANSPTGYRITNQPSWLSINATTGVVSGTPTAAGTINVNLTADNSAGSDTITLVLTVAGGSTGGTIASYAGTYTGAILQIQNGIAFVLGGATYSTVITSAGAVTTTITNAGSSTTLTGTINAIGAIAFTGGTGAAIYRITTGAVVTSGTRLVFSTPLTTAGYVLQNSSNFVAGAAGGGSTGGNVANYAGRYLGMIGRRAGTSTDANYQAYAVTIAPTGAVSATFANFNNALTGTIAANGVITFTGGSQFANYGITIANVTGTTFSADYGTAINNAQYRFEASTAFVPDATVVRVATAPANLVGYRSRVGSVFQFAVTGTSSGAIWGTDVYTDDSSVATAAVHAGVLAVGETRTVTITLLSGQPNYTASTRNNVNASAGGAWAGSFSFAGAGSVASSASAANVATARPAAAAGFTATTTSLAVGGRLVCPVNVTGGGTYSYRWYLNGVLIAGATANPYIVESLTSANAGTYSADVTNALGTTRILAGTIVVGAAGSPVLALQPISKIVIPGATFTLATNASGSALTYQWFRNNTALSGETGAILLRNNATATDAGSYSVRVSNNSGSVTSNAATVTLSADASRPANISVRTNVATDVTVIPGFFVQGTGTKRVLIRAVGPGLGAFGLSGLMADPKFSVFQGDTKIAENNDWSAGNIGSAFTATGAFALPGGSKDAALVTDLTAGRGYTVQVTNATGAGGIVLIEVYDADALTGRSTSKLVNVSVRGQTAPGDDVLTLGLVIGGIGPRTLLVRGVGPKLAAFGVTGTVADPRLQIFDSQQRAILANDDWSNADFVSELALAANYVGAFALDAGSRDAATLALVDPGAYTIQLSGTAAAPTGEALVEVYEVP